MNDVSIFIRKPFQSHFDTYLFHYLDTFKTGSRKIEDTYLQIINYL